MKVYENYNSVEKKAKKKKSSNLDTKKKRKKQSLRLRFFLCLGQRAYGEESKYAIRKILGPIYFEIS